jgi:dTDP-4-dehydrorhamnose reductase
MHVLITGSNGFLGKYFVRFLSNDCNISTLSRSIGDFKIDLGKAVPEFKLNYY